MAIRRLSKARRWAFPLRQVAARWRGRDVLNAAVPIAIERFSGRPFFDTWVSIKLGLRRRGRK